MPGVFHAVSYLHQRPRMDELDNIVNEAEAEIASARSTSELAQIETRSLGKNGSIQAQLKSIGSLPKDERPAFGARINGAKDLLTEKLGRRRSDLEALETVEKLNEEAIDITLPGRPIPAGRRHPLTSTMIRVKEVLSGLGYEFVEGPELEEYAYNFAALNYPEDHPAFDEMMTFYVDDTRLLRTQTTALQGRVMSQRKPPFRIATTGRCFRYEAVDATHHHTFHQVDVFMVDEGISMADLKGTLKQFASAMFGGDVRVRFRPDFFPFVEPGVDYSIYWQDRWLELGGAGLIHPNILEAYDIDSERWTGFAFGLGIERTHLIQNGVSDLRLYLENDLRFLRQY
jgi:phenylalanyl-tRNA synthetase alpha chain